MLRFHLGATAIPNSGGGSPLPRRFVVARNPEPDSTLPYLIRLPLPEGDLILKARDVWPRTAKVYCHRVESWPEQPEILEKVPIRSCVRRGVAVDLVLDRRRENRSQLVFTEIQGGREGIFWQSARTTRKTRPGIRLPTRRAGGHATLEILVDTRERYPYRFTRQQVVTNRHALPVGDYGVMLDGDLVGVVERKSLADLTARLVDGQLAYALAELVTLPRCAVVVEDRTPICSSWSTSSRGGSPSSCPRSSSATRASRSCSARRDPSRKTGPTDSLGQP